VDFDVSHAQEHGLAELDRLIGTAHPAAGGRSGPDPDLDAALGELCHGRDLLDRVLLVQRAAELAVPSTFGLRALLPKDVADASPDGSVGIADAQRHGPVRYSPHVQSVVVVDADVVRLLPVAPGAVTPVDSSFGYPYGELSLIAGRTLPAAVAAEVRRRWALCLVAEMTGAMTAALAHTAGHLKRREQFGRPLSTFQALRHRLAEVAVSVESLTWMAREAAWHDDEEHVWRAAVYAVTTAARMVPELSQMCGARSFSLEFGLHAHTMRVTGLRLELGGLDRVSAAYLDTTG
jgi:hypothetical protein